MSRKDEIVCAVATEQPDSLVLLTGAEQERLAILVEELAEASKVAGKILRFGYTPVSKGMFYNNRLNLELELGDVRAAMIRLCNAGDCDKKAIHNRAEEKLAPGGTILNFQE